LQRYLWTDDPVTTSTHIRAVHFTELRAAIQDLWTHAGQGTVPNWSAGSAPSPSRQISARDINDLRTWVNQYDPATIIGAQWANASPSVHPWGSKSGWDVELVYATVDPNSNDPNSLTTVGNRIQLLRQANLLMNVLVRVDYSPAPSGGYAQSIPPQNNDAARTAYVNFLATLSRDSRFNQNAWGYIIGNEYNISAENGGGTPISPTWYARVFNGYSVPSGDTGNAYQTIKTYQPHANVLVGPVGPWNAQGLPDDSSTYTIPCPSRQQGQNTHVAWLDYFNEVCSNIYSMVATKGKVDGFAIHAYGRTGADGSQHGGASEPNQTYDNDNQQGWAPCAWYGFAVYKNWRDVINQRFPGTPIFATETNTDVDAACNTSYPSGWYLNALAEIHNAGPQFWALCWFLDQPIGIDSSSRFWNDSLQVGAGNTAQARADFDNALRTLNY